GNESPPRYFIPLGLMLGPEKSWDVKRPQSSREDVIVKIPGLSESRGRFHQLKPRSARRHWSSIAVDGIGTGQNNVQASFQASGVLLMINGGLLTQCSVAGVPVLLACAQGGSSTFTFWERLCTMKIRLPRFLCSSVELYKIWYGELSLPGMLSDQKQHVRVSPSSESVGKQRAQIGLQFTNMTIL
ncbi:hypothetical protein THAOC_09042, partial [Thalassiosira oceanica]